MLIKHCIKIFIDNKKIMNISKRTLENYESYLRDFEKYYTSKEVIQINELDTSFMRTYILYRRETLGNKESTVNTHIRLFKSFFNEMVREEIVEKSPMERIKYMIEDICIETFNEEHINKMINYFIRRRRKGYEFFNERGYITVKVLLGTGIRSGEMINLRWTDIDFVKDTLTVFGQARRIRVIPLHQELKADLATYKLYLESIFDEVSESDYIFCSGENTKSSKCAIDNVFKRLTKIMKFKDVRCSPHTFRHTFCKNWIISGGDVFSLQKMLGHQKLESTQKYVNLFSTAMREQNNRYNPLSTMHL